MTAFPLFSHRMLDPLNTEKFNLPIPRKMKSLVTKIAATLIITASVASASIELYSINEDGNYSLPSFNVYADDSIYGVGEISNWKFEPTVNVSGERIAIDVLTPGNEETAVVLTPAISMSLAKGNDSNASE